MENLGDNKTNTVFEVVPNCDLTLVIGPEESKIRVQSRVLMAASKPFAAMLGPNWKEGHDRLHCGGSIELSLPEDNASAFKTVCLVLHHQNKQVPRTLPGVDVLAIAVAADKYDCSIALTFAIDSWLRTSSTEPDQLMLLTAAAYLFQHAEAFNELTSKLIVGYAGPFLALSSRDIEAAMTWRVFCQLEERRAVARLEVAETLIAGVDDVSALCVHKCGWTSKYAYAYIKLLEDVRLWPSNLSRISISEVLGLVEKMPDPVPKESSGSCTYGYNHSPPEYRKNRRWRADTFQGLCLRCVRSGSAESKCVQRSHGFKGLY